MLSPVSKHQRRGIRAHTLVQLDVAAGTDASGMIGPGMPLVLYVPGTRRKLLQARVIQLHVGQHCSLLLVRPLHA
ncbi:hypothetical protein LMG1860_04591 [Achromobacter denitrificans]|nr:hypothetical protein LMG1860_04591 [Achromobacter denitrificans]